MKRILMSLILAVAATACAENILYVVKTDSSTLYFDTTALNSKINPGDVFTVFEDGEMLKNPVTGMELGRIKINIATGAISEVAEKYAIGTVTYSKTPVKTGYTAYISQKAMISAEPDKTEKKPVWTSQAIPGQIISVNVCDIDGDGTKEILAATPKKVSVYSIKNSSLTEKYQWTAPDMRRILNVESGDIKNTGRDQLFISVFSDYGGFETIVLETEKAELVKTDSLKWLVRNIATPWEKSRMCLQEMFENDSVDRSGIYWLDFSDGKFRKGAQAAKKTRADWIYGFTMADFNGNSTQDPLYTTESGKLRVQFGKKGNYWESENDFGKTANRIKWRNRILRIYNRIPLLNESGRIRIYAVSNNAKSGLLADSFGMYKSSELYCFEWNGMTMKLKWKTHIDGYISDIQGGAAGSMPAGILASADGPSGESFLMIFEP